MNSNHATQDDRETLCALFDDELQGDEARFALKRLGHDAQWREACGRWQLYGDVLRGQAQAVAPAGFAERVALSIAQEDTLRTADTPVASRPTTLHRGWIGGALAASVAVAALFVVRPFADSDAPTTRSAPAQVAAAPSVVTPSLPRPAIPQRMPTPQAPVQTADLAAAAVAVAEVPRRAVERRASRGQNQRAAVRASRQNTLPAVAAASVAASAVAGVDAIRASVMPATSPAATNPFHPGHADAVSRPWPRAVLPQYSGGNSGMTASFGTGSASPSFYPFEPQPVQAEPESTGDDDGSLQR
ncbi:RseA family anti-sigma factor [Lysobacter sp. LF1]|uniref:RseA family anti-sigma factor n=1 Tax=Lysobacter stagni TaxID=3045172 RepID=A0ABT6XGU7_9GAMM|nr:RseA family anti-sigma factor [Lysobacter sp. LF1]MDI9239383.1 RseA family anti-sigma factor [Lysobacter sp. LF1]